MILEFCAVRFNGVWKKGDRETSTVVIIVRRAFLKIYLIRFVLPKGIP